MKTFPVSLVDFQMLEMFKFLTTPDKNLEFVEEMIQVCQQFFGHEDTEKEINAFMQHKSYQYLRALFLIRFEEDITKHFNDHIHVCKEMDRVIP